MIRTILFDMGNVLVHFSHARMCQQLAALVGRTESEVRGWLFDTGVHVSCDRGTLTPEEFHRWFEQQAGKDLRLDQLKFAASDIFAVNTPMLPILDTLREQGKRLVLLSNTSAWHFEFVQREFGVLDRFDDFVLSYAVQANKPEPEIFHAALAKIDCAPEECFYTDDIEEYVLAGRSHGLQAEVFTTAEVLRGQLAARGVQV